MYDIANIGSDILVDIRRIGKQLNNLRVILDINARRYLTQIDLWFVPSSLSPLEVLPY